MADVGAPPKMNREQKRAFRKWLQTPEGKASVAKVKANNARKAAMEAAVKEAQR